MPVEPPPDTPAGKADARPCPICGKPSTGTSLPFCSERCREVDLNRWLSDSYAIAGDDDEDEGGQQN
jgi:uncharacterized protein